MANVNAFPRNKSSNWTLRDFLAVGAALALVIAITGALATRDAWSPANANVPAVIATLNTMDYHALAFDPRDANVVYFGHHEGVMKSADGGGTWTPILREGDAMNLVTIDNTIIMAGHQVFQRSDDSGRTWKKIATNLPDHDIHGFAISPSNPKTFFAFIVSYGLWRSDDAGATWTLILRQAQDKFSKELPDTVLALAALGTNPETLYAGTLDKGLLKSVDGGIAWKPVSGLSARPALGLAQDPRDARILFVGTGSGLYRGNADGTTWTRVGLADKDIMTIAVSRANPSRILAVDAQGRVYRSDDAGASWNTK